MSEQPRNPYVEWIKDVLARKPHLSQAGLARHLDRHRSAVTMMLNGQREIKAKELALIESYFGEKMRVPGAQQTATAFVAIVGIVGNAWYEAGHAPPAKADRVAPAESVADVRQIAYIVESEYPQIGALLGATLIATPVDKAHRPQPGQVVVCKRERAGLENVALARVDEDGTIKLLAGTGDAGQPVAVAIEVRNRLA